MITFKTEEALNRYKENYLIPEKLSFIELLENSRTSIILNGTKNDGGFYRKYMQKEELKHMWIFNVIRQNCLSFLKNNRIDVLGRFVDGKIKNSDKIKDIEPNYRFLSTDINHCYWRVAYLENYISENLYKKCLPKRGEVSDEVYDIFKLFRNKGLSCFMSYKTWNYYKRGKLVDKKSVRNDQLAKIYSDIRNKSYLLMDGARHLCEDGFIMYNVDCIYYDKKYKKIVESHLKASNMLYTTKECIALGNKFYHEGDRKPKPF